MKLVDLKGRLPVEKASPQKALETALNEVKNAEIPHDEAIIILHSIEEEDEFYQIFQGGGCSYERILWHLEQTKRAVLENGDEEEDE